MTNDHSHQRIGFVALILLVATGCASHAEAFGERARYAPAYRGYVMAPHDGSNDPAVGAAVVVLRDPLTGDKLVCAEQVEAVREIYEDVAAEQLHDERVGLGVGIGMGIVTGGIAGLQPIGAGAVVLGLLTTELLYDGIASDDAEELLEEGVALLERKRYQQAERHFVHALVRDPLIGVFDQAYYHLGRAYVGQGKDEQARLALSLFVLRANVRDVEAYEDAEAQLRKLGVEPETCASRAPVALHW